jgi:hypothetical protein
MLASGSHARCTISALPSSIHTHCKRYCKRYVSDIRHWVRASFGQMLIISRGIHDAQSTAGKHISRHEEHGRQLLVLNESSRGGAHSCVCVDFDYLNRARFERS